MKLEQRLKEHLDIAEFKKYFNDIIMYQNPTLLRQSYAGQEKFTGRQL
jgi:hypothetical protein